MRKVRSIGFKSDLSSRLEIEIISFKDLSKALAITKDHNPYAPHHLTFNIMIIITGGNTGTHNVDFINYSYKPNSAILIAKDQVHSFVDIPNQNEGYLLLFTQKVFLDVGIQFPNIIDHFFNNRLYKPVHEISPNSIHEISTLIGHMRHRISNSNDSVHDEIVKLYFKIILLEVFSCREQTSQQVKKSNTTSQFIEFQNLLKLYHKEEKQVQLYAKRMGISSKKLNQITKESMGKTAKELIISFIILEAKKLLLKKHLSSKEISFQLGFEEPTNFTKFFKTHTQMLPSEFLQAYS